MSRVTSLLSKIKSGWKWSIHQAGLVINRFPLLSFFGLLAVLLVLVVVGNILRKPAEEKAAEQLAPKAVLTYTLGDTPSITVQGKVAKTGVISIVAQAPGIVQKVAVSEGQTVNAGQRLVNLSTSYQGGNVQSVARQLSQRSYQHVVDTYDAQQALINRNRDLAEKNEVQAKELRAIGRSSQADTRSLIDLNEEVIDNMDDQIAALEAVNADGSKDNAIGQLKSGKAQVLAGLNGLKAGLKASEYTNNEDEEIAGITGLVKETTLRSLDLQAKALDLNKDIAALNLRMAQISESLMYPAAPCAGVVERVYVNVGESVNPGTVIATIKANQSSTDVEVLVAGPIADLISRIAPSTVMIGESKLTLVPRYISSEPTVGSLHSILFTLPAQYANDVKNDQYITVQLPFGSGIRSGAYVPLDAVYYSQTGAFVYVADRSQSPAVAKAAQVKLGEVYGQMVEVREGLASESAVILDRNIIETDPVEIK